MSPIAHASTLPPAADSCGEAATLRGPFRTRRRILAVGAERQSSICLYHVDQAYCPETLGDLSHPAVYRAYRRQIEQHIRLRAFKPDIVAHDLHPLYLSTQYARELAAMGAVAVGVQHHHAHIVSVMAEHRLARPVIGVCCDGLGFGDDGAAWGCEVLYATLAAYTRIGHLDYFPLLGGDAAATETWRSAYALVRQSMEHEQCGLIRAGIPREALACFDQVPAEQLEVLERLWASALNAPPTSSLGRVFDAISFLLGLCDRNDRPAQAAIALEQCALPGPAEPYPYETTVGPEGIRMSLSATIRSILRDHAHRQNRGRISARFHETVARMLVATTLIAAERSGVTAVVLSGGCFANARLRTRTTELLERRRLKVYSPQLVPIGDAGIALGQAVVAAARLEGESSTMDGDE